MQAWQMRILASACMMWSKICRARQPWWRLPRVWAGWRCTEPAIRAKHKLASTLAWTTDEREPMWKKLIYSAAAFLIAVRRA